MAAEEELLGKVRRKLRITYNDTDTDGRVSDIMEMAEADLRDLLGIPSSADFDFRTGVEGMLLVNYCFYAWNDAVDDFENNYGGQIARCREKWMAYHAEDE